LRGTGILKRRAQGNDVDQISNDVGMSRQMVERYMRFKDQMEVAAAGRLRLVKMRGGPRTRVVLYQPPPTPDLQNQKQRLQN
jgi:hypothetical protein